MKITLKLDAKLVKQRPYHLNPKYKEKVCLELDKMLTAGIITQRPARGKVAWKKRKPFGSEGLFALVGDRGFEPR